MTTDSLSQLPLFRNSSDDHLNTDTIPLTKGYETIVSVEDADLANFKWQVMETNGLHYAYGRMPSAGRKKLLLHRVILGRILGRELTRTEQTDHINSNPLDNRRENLRIATNAQNQHNKGRYLNNKSGYKGVHWDRQKGKWRAEIQTMGKRTYLGYFPTPEEAYAAYCEAALKYHGEFAYFE